MQFDPCAQEEPSRTRLSSKNNIFFSLWSYYIFIGGCRYVLFSANKDSAAVCSGSIGKPLFRSNNVFRSCDYMTSTKGGNLEREKIFNKDKC